MTFVVAFALGFIVTWIVADIRDIVGGANVVSLED